MLESAPTFVIATGVDWAAIVASISTGVAALAGIGATLWAATRGWHREDQRARNVEKRRVYATCLASLGACLIAMTRQMGLKDSPELIQAQREYELAARAAVQATTELTLIAPNEIAGIAAAALNSLYGAGENHLNALSQAMNELTKAMRADLGEVPIAIGSDS
jgi:hypothetical protein